MFCPPIQHDAVVQLQQNVFCPYICSDAAEQPPHEMFCHHFQYNTVVECHHISNCVRVCVLSSHLVKHSCVAESENNIAPLYLDVTGDLFVSPYVHNSDVHESGSICICTSAKTI